MIQKLNTTLDPVAGCANHCGRRQNESDNHYLANLCKTLFAKHFNRRPFKIGHRLSDHSAFSLRSLIELSKELPADNVEYNAGNLPVSQDPTKTPQNGLSISETIDRIENCQSWLVLKNVEQSPTYRQLLEDCLEEMRPFVELASRGMTHKQGFIFISSPGSITPFHIDPENNFLLQIRGSKTVWMFGQEDREVLTESQIEEFFGGGAHRNLEFKEEFRKRGRKFELLPGEGLHFPVVAPHYVENGPEVSVSFSITFQTEDSSDRQTLHRFNRQLRRWGWRPGDVGLNPIADARKLAVLRFFRSVKRMLKPNRSV
jgi:hypothetical protein